MSDRASGDHATVAHSSPAAANAQPAACSQFTFSGGESFPVSKCEVCGFAKRKHTSPVGDGCSDAALARGEVTTDAPAAAPLPALVLHGAAGEAIKCCDRFTFASGESFPVSKCEVCGFSKMKHTNPAASAQMAQPAAMHVSGAAGQCCVQFTFSGESFPVSKCEVCGYSKMKHASSTASTAREVAECTSETERSARSFGKLLDRHSCPRFQISHGQEQSADAACGQCGSPKSSHPPDFHFLNPSVRAVSGDGRLVALGTEKLRSAACASFNFTGVGNPLPVSKCHTCGISKRLHSTSSDVSSSSDTASPARVSNMKVSDAMQTLKRAVQSADWQLFCDVNQSFDFSSQAAQTHSNFTKGFSVLSEAVKLGPDSAAAEAGAGADESTTSSSCERLGDRAKIVLAILQHKPLLPRDSIQEIGSIAYDLIKWPQAVRHKVLQSCFGDLGSALVMAIEKRSCELINDIVSLGVSVNSVDVISGQTPLQQTRNVQVAALLLNLGAELLNNLPDDRKQFSPIWMAARNCDAGMFKLLADAGAVVDAALFRHYVTFGAEASIGQFICEKLKAQARYADPQARLDMAIDIADVSFRSPRASSSKCVEWFIQTSFIHDLTAFVRASLRRWTEQQCCEVLVPLIVAGHFKPALETPFEDQCSVSIAIDRRMFALALTLANHGCSVSQLTSGKQMQLYHQSNEIHLLRMLVSNGCCDALQAAVNELDRREQEQLVQSDIRREAERVRARSNLANAQLADARRQAEEARRRRFMTAESIDLADAGTVLLAVDPNDLVESSIDAVERALMDNPQAFHNASFAVNYIGEDGYDAGGLMRDWLTRLINELKDHSKGVLLHLERDGTPTGVCTLQPSRHWLQTHELRTKRFFRLLGFVIGVALSLQPPLPLGIMFPVSLCRSLRDPTGQDAPALSDLQEVDEDEYRSLCSLMNDANAGAYGQDYVRFWSTPSREQFAAVNSSGCEEQENPVVRTMSAVAGRDASEEVALDEIPAYVDAVVQKRLVNDMRDQLNLVREGLMHAGVFDCELPQGWFQAWSEEHCAFYFYQKDGSCQWKCPAHEDGSFSLRWQYVSAQSLRSTICGSQSIDIDEWQACTDFKDVSGRDDESSSVVEAWFWEVVRGMNFSQQQQLLYWISGCMAPPASGFGHFGRRFILSVTSSSSDHLPESHT